MIPLHILAERINRHLFDCSFHKRPINHELFFQFIQSYFQQVTALGVWPKPDNSFSQDIPLSRPWSYGGNLFQPKEDTEPFSRPLE
jgi:hypothetical protein